MMTPVPSIGSTAPDCKPAAHPGALYYRPASDIDDHARAGMRVRPDVSPIRLARKHPLGWAWGCCR
jgi:hypothetical protein